LGYGASKNGQNDWDNPAKIVFLNAAGKMPQYIWAKAGQIGFDG
jgi:hypothetical protein